MTEFRRSERHYIKDFDRFGVEIEFSPTRKYYAYLRDISQHGMCMIVAREVYVPLQKDIKFTIFSRDKDGIIQKKIPVTGRVIWYMIREFKEKDFQFIGIDFSEPINLHDGLGEIMKLLLLSGMEES